MYTQIPAHMSLKELDVMDSLQEMSHHVNGDSRVRLYTHEFEQALANPAFAKAILAHVRKKYATGGEVGRPTLSHEELEGYRREGRNGDNAIGIFGPRGITLLRIAAGHHGTINPETGLPEFFSLGSLFDSIGGGLSSLFGGAAKGLSSIPGIGSLVSKVAPMAGNFLSGVLPQIAPMAGQALGTMAGGFFGGPEGALMGGQLGNSLGGSLGQMGGNALQSAMQGMGQQPSPQMQQMAQMAGQGLGGMAQNVYGGMDPRMAAAQGMQNFAQQAMPGSALGGGLSAMANQFGQGASPLQMLQAGYQGAGGMPSLLDAGRQAYQRFMGGQQQMGNPMQQQQQQGESMLGAEPQMQ